MWTNVLGYGTSLYASNTYNTTYYDQSPRLTEPKSMTSYNTLLGEYKSYSKSDFTQTSASHQPE